MSISVNQKKKPLRRLLEKRTRWQLIVFQRNQLGLTFWPEPSFEGLRLYLFCPYNNRISQALQCPCTLVLSQTTRLTFPLLVSVAWKKSPRLLTQSQEAMLRYVCAVIRQSDGRQIWEGQRWSRTHTQEHTHTATASAKHGQAALC